MPGLLRLVDERPPSGRYRAADLPPPAVDGAMTAAATRFRSRAGAPAPSRRRRAGCPGTACGCSSPGRDGVQHAQFRDLAGFLRPGDLVVVNTSATVAAAVDGARGDGRPVVVHVSSPLDDGTLGRRAARRPTGRRTR